MKSLIWLLCLLICVHCSLSQDGGDGETDHVDDESNKAIGADGDGNNKGPNPKISTTLNTTNTTAGNVSVPTTSITTVNPNVPTTTLSDAHTTSKSVTPKESTEATTNLNATGGTKEPGVVTTTTVHSTPTKKKFDISKLSNKTILRMFNKYKNAAKSRGLLLDATAAAKRPSEQVEATTTKGTITKGTTTKGTKTKSTTTKGTTTAPTSVTTTPSEQVDATTTKGTTTKGTTTKGTTTKGTTTKGTKTKGTTTKGTKTKGTKDDEEQIIGPKPANRTPGSSHFAVVFLVMIALLFGLYALYHNRQKIIAVVVEGRSAHGHGGRDRYKRLDNESVEPEARIKNSNEVYVY